MNDQQMFEDCYNDDTDDYDWLEPDRDGGWVKYLEYYGIN